jgi:hypothetical protein
MVAGWSSPAMAKILHQFARNKNMAGEISPNASTFGAFECMCVT